MTLRKDATTIFQAGVDAVIPTRLIRDALQRDGDILRVDGREYSLHHNVRIIAFGKAVLPMIRGVEDVLGDHVVDGYANIPFGAVHVLQAARPELLPGACSKVALNEGAKGNMPDFAAEAGAKCILKIAEQSNSEDLLIVLISGGGSALLPLPVRGITLEEKRAATAVLSEHGATINELNTLRKHISAVKGGQLARAAKGAEVLTLILSDVIEDPLDVIASGPTVADTSTFQDCLNIINRLGIAERLPRAVVERLQQGAAGKIPDTPKAGDKALERIKCVVVGNNTRATSAAAKVARELGYNTLLLSTSIQGVAREVGCVYSAIAREILKSGNPIAPPGCILGAGETTVQVTDKEGCGGRCQELAMGAAIGLAGIKGVVLLSGGTDGQDGKTPDGKPHAAGAFADGETIARAQGSGMNPHEYLRRNDSYRFFDKLDSLFITDLTGTNVMDIQVVLINP